MSPALHSSLGRKIGTAQRVARKEIDAAVVTGMYDFKPLPNLGDCASYPADGYDYGTLRLEPVFLEPQTWHFEPMMVHGTCSLVMPIPTSILPMDHC